MLDQLRHLVSQAALSSVCFQALPVSVVEVTELPGRVAMRDSKDPAGPVLAFTRTEWRAFLGSIRTGEFG